MTRPFVTVLRKQAIIEPGIREFANAHYGESTIITYGFMTRVPAERRTDTISDPRQGFERYEAEERAVIRQSLKAWSAVADITFVPVAGGDADIMFGKHRMPYRVNGYAGGLTQDLATGETAGADIRLDNEGFVTTPFGREIATHEIGHSLGLGHAHVGRDGTSFSEFKSSVMSTNTWGPSYYTGSPIRLGLVDAAAIQSIYGPARKKLGADSYALGKTKLIWDGGGEDTISAAKAKAKAHIDMNDGSWSWVGRKAASVLDAGQSWLGHFTQIEQAVGSRHADTIIGNALDNTIIGGRGNDVITGGAGADVMTGGPGRDRFVNRSFAEMGSGDGIT